MTVNNVPVTAYKSIAANDYRITKYPVYAPHTYTYASGSTNNSVDVQILYGIKYTGSAALRETNTQNELYDSVSQSFYSPLPASLYGISPSKYLPSHSLYVVSITQDIFGEEIRPSTFTLTFNGSSSYDDGNGNLYISQSNIGYYIGNVFYDQGIAVLQARPGASSEISSNGLWISGSSPVQVQFTSSVKLYEHLLRVQIDPAEFTISPYNPSVSSASFTGSSVPMIDYMVSKSMGINENSASFAPYVTSIGFYNSENDLLAVAKVSMPIKRTFDTTQTFVVKFDI